MRIPSKEERAWVAGFIEGEGCFTPQQSTYKGKKTYAFRVSASQVEREPLERLQKMFGVGQIYEMPRDKPHSTCHVWMITKTGEAMTAIGMIWPYLSRRRKEQIWNASLKVKGFNGLEAA